MRCLIHTFILLTSLTWGLSLSESTTPGISSLSDVNDDMDGVEDEKDDDEPSSLYGKILELARSDFLWSQKLSRPISLNICSLFPTPSGDFNTGMCSSSSSSAFEEGNVSKLDLLMELRDHIRDECRADEMRCNTDYLTYHILNWFTSSSKLGTYLVKKVKKDICELYSMTYDKELRLCTNKTRIPLLGKHLTEYAYPSSYNSFHLFKNAVTGQWTALEPK